MEFGIFSNGYVPGPAAHDSESEHTALMREIELAIHADRHNWKYVWFGEHHALTEYSHLSAPEVVIGYVAHATEQIHMGTAIMNISPRVNHPVRSAERAAMMVENALSTERKRIAALLEPMLMMLVGAFVLTIVLSVLLPIFDLQAVVAG